VQRVRGDAVNLVRAWARLELAWSPTLTETEYWFVFEGMLRALWIEEPAPGRISGVESTVPGGDA